MFTQKLLLVALAVLTTVAANRSSHCKDCIGDSLIDIIKRYDSIGQCWFSENHRVLLNEKLYVMKTIVESWKNTQNLHNQLAAEKCKINVPVKPCEMEDVDEQAQCLVDAMQTYVYAHRDQEICEGKPFGTKEVRISSRFFNGMIMAWKRVHPDC